MEQIIPKRRKYIINNNEILYLCSKCKLYKKESDFSYRIETNKTNGNVYKYIRSECKSCKTKESAIYHRTVRLRLNNKDLINSLNDYNNFKADPLISLKRYLLRLSKNHAKSKNIEHTISIKDIIIPEECPILKTKFIGNNKKYTYSIDRVNNTKGYIPGNIKIISRLANTMKNNATNEELIKFADNIKSYIKI